MIRVVCSLTSGSRRDVPGSLTKATTLAHYYGMGFRIWRLVLVRDLLYILLLYDPIIYFQLFCYTVVFVIIYHWFYCFYVHLLWICCLTDWQIKSLKGRWTQSFVGFPPRPSPGCFKAWFQQSFDVLTDELAHSLGKFLNPTFHLEELSPPITPRRPVDSPQSRCPIDWCF